MKRKCVSIFGLVFLLLLILIFYYFKVERDQIEITKSEKMNIQNQLLDESFGNGTKLEECILEEVSISVDEVRTGTVTVIVEAPNISQDLIDWLSNSQDDLTDEQIEEKILSLLHQSEKITGAYELSCDDIDEANIRYTEEYLNAVSCGLYEFYSYAMNQLMLEMLEENTNE